MSAQTSEVSNLVEEPTVGLEEAVEEVTLNKDVEEEIRQALEEANEVLHSSVSQKQLTKLPDSASL